MSSQRLDYIDIMKGFAIASVVTMHVSSPVEPAAISKFVSSFAMQLFFMAAGMVSHSPEGYALENIRQNVRRKFLSLMVPYFIWCLILTPPSVANIGKMLYGSFDGLLTINPFVVHLWFLPSFFLASIMLNALLNLFARATNRYLLPILTLTTFVIGFVLPKIPTGYPWGVNLSFVALGFMLSGFCGKEFILRMNSKSVLVQIAFVLVSAAVLAVGNLYGIKDVWFISMCSTEFGPVGWFWLNGLAGIIMVRAISSLLAKASERSRLNGMKRVAIWLGQNTMGIFIVQMPICICGVIPLMLRLGMSPNNSLHVILAAVVALMVSAIATWGIKKLCPQIFGK